MSPAAPALVPYPHIELDSSGIPFIVGSTMKVVELVMAQRAHGWSPDELSFQFPHLSMAQVHAALAYYWDHRDILDADIERRSELVEASRRKQSQSRLAQKLERLKHGA